MAEELAHVHQRHCGREQDQRVAVSEQYGDFEAAQRGSVRLLERTDDPDQGEASQGDHV